MTTETIHFITTGLIFILGVSTVLLSLYACYKFNKFKPRLSHSASSLSGAISYQLAGEAIIGFGTLLFASAEFLGILSSWGYYFPSFLRFVMFVATSLTTLHLVIVLDTLHKINK